MYKNIPSQNPAPVNKLNISAPQSYFAQNLLNVEGKDPSRCL
jgi:hypothetical protein